LHSAEPENDFHFKLHPSETNATAVRKIAFSVFCYGYTDEKKKTHVIDKFYSTNR